MQPGATDLSHHSRLSYVIPSEVVQAVVPTACLLSSVVDTTTATPGPGRGQGLPNESRIQNTSNYE